MNLELDKLMQELQVEVEGLDFQSLDSFESPAEIKRREWLELRRGRFTASEAVRLMGYEDKLEMPEGAITYATECALEILTESQPERKSFGSAIDWGNQYEKEANEKFQEKFSIEVENYGEEQEFIKKGDDFGCTPDGLILKTGIIEGGTETKCPDSKTHLFYLMNLNEYNFKKLCTKYYWQIQTSMYVTGASYWYFISYDPRFKNEEKRLFVLTIKRNDEDINKFRRRLSGAIKIKNEILNKIK